MINVLFVPTVTMDLSLVRKLQESIDYPLDLRIHSNRFKNIGVAASWNLCPNKFSHANSWIIVNEDVQFEPGALGEFCRKVDELADKEPFIMWNESEGFCCFAWTRVGVERFGLFDENFYPAYLEDWDMKMRWKIAGYRPPNVFGKDCPLKHGKPQCGGPRYNKMIQDGAELRKDYFMRKWGTMDYSNPAYNSPFATETETIKDWTIEPDLRAKLQKTWDDFISQPNPSIYT